MEQIELWNKCLKMFKDIVTESHYKTWFEPLVPLKYEKDEFILQIPSEYYYEMLEEKFSDLIHLVLGKVSGKELRLIYKIQEGTAYPEKSKEEKQARDAVAEQEFDSQLNSIYNFSTFMEGTSNQLARSAGFSIASEPGKTPFNPLFLYGQSGVGKTHLAQAIGLKAKQLFPEKRVLYLSANLFYIQYTDATLKNKSTDFLNFYQSIDVLIIDDIQTLATKAKTQQTFFHIFNHLHQMGKQLILTSDKAPAALQGMEERLLTRFKWGLVAEIKKPDFELRKAILKNKIYKDGLDISDEVVDFIAKNVVDNVRDLEGVLVSLMAHATFANEEINLELAEKVIANVVDQKPQELSVEKIRDVVCDYFGLSVDKVLSKSRVREVTNARQIAMYLSKQMTKSSLSEIGRGVGNRDHATVLHSCSVVNDLMDTDKEFKRNVQALEQILRG